MLIRVGLILFALLVNQSLRASGITFNEQTWPEIIKTSQNQNRLIFVDVFTTWCGPCKKMEQNVFVDDQVGAYFNEHFINTRIDAEKGEGVKFAKHFMVDAYPTFLFINGAGELVHRVVGSMAIHQFLSEAAFALEFSKDFQPLHVLEEQFSSGNRNPEFIKLLLKRKKMNLENTNDLLEEFLLSIPDSSRYTLEILKIISENNLSITSTGFKILVEAEKRLLSMSKDQVRVIYQGLTSAKQNTIRLAILHKDTALLGDLIKEIKSKNSFGNNFEIRNFQIQFAKATKNQKMFIDLIQDETEKLMAKTEEQMQNESKMTRNMRIFAAKMSSIDTSSLEFKNELLQSENSGFTLTATRLNEIAWNYFEFVEDPELLQKALVWASHAIELNRLPGNIDTKAQILYKLGRIHEAIETQEEAISLAKTLGEDYTGIDATLQKMKKKE